MNKPEETIKIKMKPAALRSLAKMIHKWWANEALFEDARANEVEAAEDKIQSMEHEIARLQQQVEQHKETIARVTRERDEMAVRIARARAEANHYRRERDEMVGRATTDAVALAKALIARRDAMRDQPAALRAQLTDAEKAPEEKSDE